MEIESPLCYRNKYVDSSIDARNTLGPFSHLIDGAFHTLVHLIFVRHEPSKILFKHDQKHLLFLILFPVRLNSTHYFLRMRKYCVREEIWWSCCYSVSSSRIIMIGKGYTTYSMSVKKQITPVIGIGSWWKNISLIAIFFVRNGCNYFGNISLRYKWGNYI